MSDKPSVLLFRWFVVYNGNMFHFLRKKIDAAPGWILGMAVLVFILLATGITTWKYFFYQYNALDLAIFTQVIDQTSQGNWFAFTIHPSSYLGDHLELLIVLVAGLYRFISHPIFLLFLQNLVLGLSAWPLYLTVRGLRSRRLALAGGLLWLVNPFLQNIATFEWHMLPFAIFTVSWSCYFYARGKFRWFMVWVAISLLIREDVALFTAMFGVLALLEKRRWWWIVVPLVASVGYFVAALQMVHLFNPDETYKFLYYYPWLEGGSLGEKLWHVVTHPWQPVLHLLHPAHFIFVVALLVPYAFLPLVRPRKLVLLIGVLLQLLLTSFYGSPIILETHYSSLLLLPLLLASADGLQFLLSTDSSGSRWHAWCKKLFTWDRRLSFVLLASVFIYASLTWGSFSRGAVEIVKNFDASRLSRSVWSFLLDDIPDNGSVAAAFSALPALAQRAQLYSLHYAFIGQRQYSLVPYELPADTQWMVFDADDVRVYQWQFSGSRIYGDNYAAGFGRLDTLLLEGHYGVRKIMDSRVVFEKNADDALKLFTVTDQEPARLINQALGSGLVFKGWESFAVPEQGFSDSYVEVLPISLFFQTEESIGINYQFELSLVDDDQVLYHKTYPFAYGLYPTSYWQAGETVQTNWLFAVPRDAVTRAEALWIQVIEPINGHISLNGYSTAQIESEERAVGEPVVIPLEQFDFSADEAP